MRFQRVIQFNMALVDTFRSISEEDMKFVGKYLHHDGINMFMCMNNMNKHHCIRVAKAIIKNKDMFIIDDKLDKVVVAALLHDVGKSKCKQGIVFKVLFVLCKNQYKNGHIKWAEAHKYYNHARISRDMLQNKNIDSMVLDLIENHHVENYNKNDQYDKYLEALKYCDENN